MKKRTILGVAAMVVVAALCVALGTWSSRPPKPAGGDGIYTPGTYTSEQQGFLGTVTVKVTVDANSITDVQIEAPDETPDLGGEAAKTMAAAALEANSAEVDGVAGATYTSEAVKAGLADCLAKAKGGASGGLYTPGTYEASAQGFQSPVKVTVTVDANSVTDVKVDSSGETESLGGAAGETLAANALAANGGEFDGVAGATLTSEAVKTAVAECLAQARGEKAPAASTGMKPGTYTGEAQGIRSTVKVSVTVTADGITDIKILEHGETRNIAEAALEQMPARILDSQSLGVDAVSSVTFTSTAVVNAVANALEQAGADMEALRQKVDVTRSDETVTADVVVVGMGLAGVTASMSALDEGATVVAVEKMGAAGGSSKYSGGFISAFETETQLSQGFTMTADDFVQSFYAQQEASVKTEEIDRAAISAMIHRSASDVDFLNSHGVALNPKPTNFGDGIGYWFFPAERTGPFDGEAAGADHIVNGIKYLNKQDGFSIYYDTPATKLLTDGQGNITGVLCEREDGSKLTVNAKSVVLASGGWAASPELMKRFCPDFPQEWVMPYTTANMGNTGDGITMAEALGAAVYENGWWMDLANGVDVGGYQTYFPNTLNGMIDYNLHLVVNGKGERCTNTSSLYGPRSIDYAKAMKETGAVFAIYTHDSLPNAIELIEKDGRVDGQNIYKADTLADLAAQTGMDASTLEAQVTRFNGICADGTDPDFGQAAYKLVPVGEKGPFYALRIKTITMGTLGGLRTNDDNQVLNTSGAPMAGLYAAGELINGKYFNQCYVSGCAQLLCTDSGIIAGANAAKAALGTGAQTPVETDTPAPETTPAPEATPAPEVPAGIYKPGTYTGTGEGFGGDVTATVTVDDNNITSVTLEGPGETPAIGGAALETLAANAKAQGADMDGVSGASVTSGAAKAAVAAALAQAKR